MERRYLPSAAARVEVRGDENHPRIVGHAAVYYDGTSETEYRIWDDLVERIMPGAFDRALEEGDDARALFNHDPSQILGRVSAGTLSLSSEDRGLAYDIDPPDTTVGHDVVTSVRRGDLQGSSFAFAVTDQEFRTEDGVDIREITGVELYDVGPVTYPAYESTTTGIRCKDDAEELILAWRAWRTERDADREQRSRGFRARQFGQLEIE